MSATRAYQTIWVLLAAGLAIGSLWFLTGGGAPQRAFGDETSGGSFALVDPIDDQLPYLTETGHAGVNSADLDPVMVGTGELRHQETDLEVPSLGIPFRFTRVYRSGVAYNGPLGKQWDFNYNTRLHVDTTGQPTTLIYLYDGTGRADTFELDDSGDYYPTDASRFEKLLNVSTSSPTTITRVLASPRLKYHYSNEFVALETKKFRLAEITNEFGHSMTFSYDTSGRLTGISDSEGGSYAITYNTNGYLEKITDIASRTIEYIYDGPSGNLIEVKEFCGADTCSTKYTYKTNTSLLKTVMSPKEVAKGTEGVPYLTNTYENNSHRIKEQTSGEGDYVVTYPQSGNTPVEILDRNGDKRVYHFDSFGRTTLIAVHEGTSATFSTEYTYHTHGQIHQIKHPVIPGTTDRRIQEFTYDTSTDPIKRSRLLTRKLIPATTNKGEQDLVWTFGSYSSQWNIPLSETDPNGLEATRTITGTHPAYVFTTTTGKAGGTQATTTSNYDNNGRLDTILNAESETKFYYLATDPAPPSGMVSSIAVKVSGNYQLVQSFTFDSRRNLKTRTDSRGKTTTYNHNGRNNLTSIVYPGGTYTMTMTYDKDDRLATRTVPVDATVTRTETITRDILGNPKDVTVEIDGTDSATTTTQYDEGERVTKVTDADGRVIQYFWNDRDLVKKIKFAPATADEACILYEYDHEGRLTTMTDGRGEVWKTAYDGHGRVWKRTDPAGHYLENVYGNGGLHPTKTDGTVVEETKFYASGGATMHRHTKFDFDDLLRIEKRHAMAKLSPTGGNVGDGWQTNTYEYDLTGRTTKIFDDRSKYVQFVYDDLGRLTSRIHETGNKVELDYANQTGLVSTRTLYENVPGSTQKQSVDTYTYDDLGRRLLHTDPGTNVSSVAYNFAGQVVTYKDPLGNLVNHSYDRRGARLQTDVQESNLTTVQSVSFSYYPSGLLKEATDGLLKKTKYEYDNRGRLKKREYLPDNTSYQWGYDDDNNLVSLTDPRGTSFAYAYDNRGLLKTITTTPGTGSNLYGENQPIVYLYNAVGEMTKICDGDSIVAFTRNTLGQINTELQVNSAEAMPTEWGRTVTSTYDDAGRRTAVTYPVNGLPGSNDVQLSYDYDDLYRLTKVDRTNGGLQNLSTYTYAGFDRLVCANYSNSTKMQITHDVRNLVTDILHSDGSGNPMFEVNRKIDPAGRTVWRRQQYTDPTAPTTPYYSDVARYYYDAASRMHCAYHGVTAPAWSSTLDETVHPTAAASKKIYSFTAVDTRNSVTAIYAGLPPIAEPYSSNGNTHEYTSATIDALAHTLANDLSGNRTSHQIGTNNNATYGYDAFDRLVFAETDIAGGQVTTVTWRHDALGRTIEEKVVGGSGTTITRYYHDGSSRVLEVTVPSEAQFSNETKVRTYVYGPEGPAPFFGRKGPDSNPTDAFFHADERGSVMGLSKVGAAGILEHYRYQKSLPGGLKEPRDYGEFTLHNGTSATVQASTGNLFGNPFLWTGSPMSHGLFNAPAARTLFVGHGGAYDPVTGVRLQRNSTGGAFAGGGHASPTATPATWGAGSGGGVSGLGGGWPGTAGVHSGEGDMGPGLGRGKPGVNFNPGFRRVPGWVYLEGSDVGGGLLTPRYRYVMTKEAHWVFVHGYRVNSVSGPEPLPIRIDLWDWVVGKVQAAASSVGSAVTNWVNNAIPDVNTILDGFQDGVSVGGMAPGVGIFADLLNVGISLARLRFGDAILHGLAAIPIAGIGINAARLAAKYIPGRKMVLSAGIRTVKAGIEGAKTVVTRVVNVTFGKNGAKIETLVHTGAGGFSGSADAAYAKIRLSRVDVGEIAAHTGIKPGNIKKVKDHLFHNQHLLDKYTDLGVPAKIGRFDSDAGIAAAWGRLRSGSHTAADLQLLRHEAAEAWSMARHGSSYKAAHGAAEARFPSPIR